MVGSCWLRFHPPCAWGRPLPRGASWSGGARARPARGQRPVPCGDGRRCGSHFLALVFFAIASAFISCLLIPPLLVPFSPSAFGRRRAGGLVEGHGTAVPGGRWPALAAL